MKRLILAGFIFLGAVFIFRAVSPYQPEESRLASAEIQGALSPAGKTRAITPQRAPQIPPDPRGGSPASNNGRLEDQLLKGPRLELQQGELDWEARVRAIQENPALSDLAKTGELLRLLGGGLPEEALESVAEDAVRALGDPNYAQASGLLLNPQTHGRVHAVLFADLVERPDPVRLPWLLAVARVPAHPYAKVAAENLELFLGVQHGGDWARWEESVRRVLKKSGENARR